MIAVNARLVDLSFSATYQSNVLLIVLIRVQLVIISGSSTCSNVWGIETSAATSFAPNLVGGCFLNVVQHR